MTTDAEHAAVLRRYVPQGYGDTELGAAIERAIELLGQPNRPTYLGEGQWLCND